MATPIGQNTIEAISRRMIDDGIVDTIYNSAPATFRALEQHRVVKRGGTQIEQPLMVSKRGTGTWYGGVEVLPVQLSDTFLNLAFDWKFYADILAFGGPQLAKADSPLAVVDIVAGQLEQARMEAVDNLSTALWTLNSPNSTNPDSIPNAIDDGTNVANYGGWARTALPAIKAKLQNDAGVLSLYNMQTAFGVAKNGGQEPTIAFTDQATYNAYWSLLQAQQRFNQDGSFKNQSLASAGFSNLLFNEIPITVDSGIQLDSGGHHQIFWMNENYWKLYVLQNREFELGEFTEIHNQDAWTAKMKLSANMVCSNPTRQALEYGITN